MGDRLRTDGREAAKSVAKGAGEVVGGLQEGVDQASAVPISVAPEVAAGGLKVTRAQPGAGHRLSVYLIAERAIKTSLVLQVADGDGQEIGRARQQIELPQGEAAYVDFEFDPRTPLHLVRAARLVEPPTADKEAAER